MPTLVCSTSLPTPIPNSKPSQSIPECCQAPISPFQSHQGGENKKNQIQEDD